MSSFHRNEFAVSVEKRDSLRRYRKHGGIFSDGVTCRRCHSLTNTGVNISRNNNNNNNNNNYNNNNSVSHPALSDFENLLKKCN